MSIKLRNLLCIKEKEKLDLGHKLLYEPYKNILVNFVDLSTNASAIEFDPISKLFDGLASISDDLRYYYEALLGVTSYYQHSQGGKGKYVEKRFSSIVQTCSLNIALSELPLWLEYPELHRKKGIFTLRGLSREEKTKLRRSSWDFVGEEDETTDLGNLFVESNKIVLVELKNRVDSGGTSARREIWIKKFKLILETLSNNTVKIYQKGNNKYSLIELLKDFNYKRLEIYIGILFNVEGVPATKQGDKDKGFYSSNEEGYRDLIKMIMNKGFKIINEDFNKLAVTLNINNFEIKFGTLYGNDIPCKLLQKKYTISNLLILKYDDIWLSQLISISERTYLLQFGKNYMTILRDTIKKDWELRKLFDEFITSEGSKDLLGKLVKYLLNNYLRNFSSHLCPSQIAKDEYLADVIQVLAASEA